MVFRWLGAFLAHGAGLLASQVRVQALVTGRAKCRCMSKLSK